jgi:hypothetical protein
LNKGLPESLKEAFPNWSPVSKPTLQVTEIQDPNWLTGFVNGDGSFHVTIAKSKTNITGYAIRLQFNIGQHSRDFKLLSSFNNYLNCGFVTLNAKLPNCSFTVTKFSDAVNIIIPFYFVFFQKKKRKKDILWRVQKKQDFMDWCRIAKLMADKTHHTCAGLSLIKEIRNGMNQRRSE